MWRCITLTAVMPSSAISGVFPAIRSAVTRAAPWLIVQPMWPWPVLNHRFFIFEGPRIGVPSGVIGLKPAQ